ncbi:hypothetical protein [Secundilactobacillus silagei]|nr:hypothetical protein [Secundilactobacillus silagei]
MTSDNIDDPITHEPIFDIHSLVSARPILLNDIRVMVLSLIVKGYYIGSLTDAEPGNINVVQIPMNIVSLPRHADEIDDLPGLNRQITKLDEDLKTITFQVTTAKVADKTDSAEFGKIWSAEYLKIMTKTNELLQENVPLCVQQVRENGDLTANPYQVYDTSHINIILDPEK